MLYFKSFICRDSLICNSSNCPFCSVSVKNTDKVITDQGYIVLVDVEQPIDKPIDNVKPIVVPPKPDVPVKNSKPYTSRTY